jgi:hypothetical protein
MRLSGALSHFANISRHSHNAEKSSAHFSISPQVQPPGCPLAQAA